MPDGYLNPYAAPRGNEFLEAQLQRETPGLKREGDVCTVEFELTEQDWLRFASFFVVESGQAGHLRRVLMLLIGILWVLSILPHLATPNLPQAIAAAICFTGGIAPLAVVVWFLCRPLAVWSARRSLKRLLKQGPARGTLGPRRLSLSPDGIVEALPHRVLQLRWTAIEKVRATPSDLYLYDSPATALAVTRQAFASEQEFQWFVQRAAQLQAAAAGSI